jgi:ATP/maltotriose-dependent transcriptional regulator MalT
MCCLSCARRVWKNVGRHLGGDQSFFDFIVGAMSTLPPHVWLVLAGRTLPQLPLAQWILEDRATLFEAADLKFNIAETEALAAARNVAIDPTRARDLCEACEGWAAGLSLSLSAGAQLIATPDGSRPALVAYLLNQISAALPDTLIEFLERTSVLESLNATFLSKFGGIPDAQDRIREIESSGAMLTVIARERVYRVHPLLREALINRIRSRNGEEGVRALHQWAGTAFEEAAEPSAALFHFEEGGDFEGMVRVLHAGNRFARCRPGGSRLRNHRAPARARHQRACAVRILDRSYHGAARRPVRRQPFCRRTCRSRDGVGRPAALRVALRAYR